MCGAARTLLQPAAESTQPGALLGSTDQEARAFAGSTPLEQWRAQGRWPASFDRFWEMLSNEGASNRERAP